MSYLATNLPSAAMAPLQLRSQRPGKAIGDGFKSIRRAFLLVPPGLLSVNICLLTGRTTSIYRQTPSRTVLYRKFIAVGGPSPACESRATQTGQGCYFFLKDKEGTLKKKVCRLWSVTLQRKSFHHPVACLNTAAHCSFANVSLNRTSRSCRATP